MTPLQNKTASFCFFEHSMVMFFLTTMYNLFSYRQQGISGQRNGYGKQSPPCLGVLRDNSAMMLFYGLFDDR